MPKVVIEIETENAAFEGVDRDRELARILRMLAAKMMDKYEYGLDYSPNLFDVNGNRVGTIRFE